MGKSYSLERHTYMVNEQDDPGITRQQRHYNNKQPPGAERSGLRSSSRRHVVRGGNASPATIAYKVISDRAYVLPDRYKFRTVHGLRPASLDKQELRFANPTLATEGAMASVVRRKVTSRVLLEKKAWYLGRFLTRAVNDVALSRLRAHVRNNKGFKTRIRLLEIGLSIGHKSVGILHEKLPYEFIPLSDMHTLVADDHNPDVLLCVTKVRDPDDDKNYEITAFRLQDAPNCRLFQHLYVDIKDRHGTAASNKLITNGTVQKNYDIPEELHITGSKNVAATNWLLKPEDMDDLETYNRSNRSWSSAGARNGEEGIAERGNSSKFRDIQSRSVSPHQTRSTSQSPSRPPYRDVGVNVRTRSPVEPESLNKSKLHTTRVYFREHQGLADVTAQIDPQRPGGDHEKPGGLQRDSIHQSSNRPAGITSSHPVNGVDRPTARSTVRTVYRPVTSDSMRNEIANLTNEVENLKVMLEDKNHNRHGVPQRLSDIRGYARQDADNDSISSSLSTVAMLNIAKRINTNVGGVKVKVGDHRRDPFSDITFETQDDNDSSLYGDNATRNSVISYGKTARDQVGRKSRTRDVAKTYSWGRDATHRRARTPEPRSRARDRLTSGVVRSRSTESYQRSRLPDDDVSSDHWRSDTPDSVKRPDDHIYRWPKRSPLILRYPVPDYRPQTAHGFESLQTRL